MLCCRSDDYLSNVTDSMRSHNSGLLRHATPARADGDQRNRLPPTAAPAPRKRGGGHLPDHSKDAIYTEGLVENAAINWRRPDHMSYVSARVCGEGGREMC
eukprot:24182-Chlamydomonas_euryale.AAC.1